MRPSAAVTWFWAFVLLSPQVYYAYDLTLFDIPLQWVVRWQGPDVIVDLLTFRGDASLSAHSQGVLGWGLICLALFARQSARQRDRRGL